MVELDNISFPKEFYRDEVRDGFYVSEMMKRFWGAQMVVLSEIEKVCKRHDIDWFTDMGSLIGVVRHKGYIPWDDDLDISMMRENYEKFFKYAKDELPEGYCLLSLEDDPEYTLALGRVTNGRAINTSKEHMDKFCGCPYVVGVDIFPIDRIYNDKDKEDARKNKIKDIYEVNARLSASGTIDKAIDLRLDRIERETGVKIKRFGNIGKDLAFALQSACSECRDEDAKEAAFMPPWAMGDRMNSPVEDFTHTIYVPFEFTNIRIPEKYDTILTRNYGDYMTPVRGLGVHQYPVYTDQEQILREKMGHNPYRYTFPSDFSVQRIQPRLKDKCIEMFDIVEKAGQKINALRAAGNEADADRLLEGARQVQASLEEILDSPFGERLDSGRKEAVFMPVKGQWWNTMKPYYDKCVADENMEVYVIPLPYYDCDYSGAVGNMHDEREYYEGVKELAGRLSSFDQYDLEKRHPDMIVIQVPYDEWSGTMTVPEKLYSANLLKFTDELVYIPCFDAEDPESEADVAASALRLLIEQPAVVNADRVIVKSDAMRELYVETMTGLAGNDTRSYWNNKIEIMK